MPTIADKLDRQRRPLYDTYEAVAGAIPNRVTFFDTRTKNSAGQQTTNMSKAGALAVPERFEVFGLSFAPIGMVRADILALMQEYTARLVVGSKTYLEAPIEFFPAASGLTGSIITAANDIFNLGAHGHHATFSVPPDLKIEIEAEEPFYVELAGTSGFTAAAAVFLRCYLDGIYWARVQ